MTGRVSEQAGGERRGASEGGGTYVARDALVLDALVGGWRRHGELRVERRIESSSGR